MSKSPQVGLFSGTQHTCKGMLRMCECNDRRHQAGTTAKAGNRLYAAAALYSEAGLVGTAQLSHINDHRQHASVLLLFQQQGHFIFVLAANSVQRYLPGRWGLGK
jgi:hypothetical protein